MQKALDVIVAQNANVPLLVNHVFEIYTSVFDNELKGGVLCPSVWSHLEPKLWFELVI